MEYRKLPHGDERISVVGLGMGGIHASPPEEIERMVDRAIEGGINYFDMCGGHSSIYAPFGRAIAGRRDKVHFQLHLGVIYNEQGEYGRSRKMDETRRTGSALLTFPLVHQPDFLFPEPRQECPPAGQIG